MELSPKTEAEIVFREYYEKHKSDDELMPQDPDDSWFCFYDYEPMIYHFGEVLHRVDIGRYQGDTLVLYKHRETGDYGYLRFGWGSCSVCDALQSCSNWNQVQALLDDLRNSIKWGDSQEILLFLIEHDWEGDGFFPVADAIEFSKVAQKEIYNRELQV